MVVTFAAQSSPAGRMRWALAELPDDVPGALALAGRLGAFRATPGDGTTADQWETLASLAAHDLGVARAVEPHLDAVAILTQAGRSSVDGSWGVFASEGGDDPVGAKRDGGRWRLSGTKQWCSLAGELDSALVTARTADGESRLFAVDLSQPGARPADGAWHARGLTEIPSGPVRFDRADAEPIGEPGWYLSRPGFSWGGIGVAACWYGGAVALGRTVRAEARRAPNPHRLAHLGAIDILLSACRLALYDAALRVDAWPGERADENAGDARLLTKRVRGLVARSCEEVIARAGHALGPGPLATDAAHAKRVADLQLYIRQHHAERDDASLGQAVADSEEEPW